MPARGAGTGTAAQRTEEQQGRHGLGNRLPDNQTFPKRVGFADIRAKTGYGEKKVRNTIYRLHSMGKITRKSRGLYVAT